MDIFVFRNTDRLPLNDSINLEELYAIQVDLNDVFSVFGLKLFTLALDPLPKRCFVERQSLSRYEGRGKWRSVAPRELMCREAIACEALPQASHPNIAKYFGCIVKDNQIAALCFQRYSEFLKTDSNVGTGL